MELVERHTQLAELDAAARDAEAGRGSTALAALHQLGARPRAAMVRRRLSELGVTRIPRSAAGGPGKPGRVDGPANRRCSACSPTA